MNVYVPSAADKIGAKYKHKVGAHDEETNNISEMYKFYFWKCSSHITHDAYKAMLDSYRDATFIQRVSALIKHCKSTISHIFQCENSNSKGPIVQLINDI